MSVVENPALCISRVKVERFVFPWSTGTSNVMLESGF